MKKLFPILIAFVTILGVMPFTASSASAATLPTLVSATTVANVAAYDIPTLTLTGGVTATAATATMTVTDPLPANATDKLVNIDGLGAIDLGNTALSSAEIAAAIRAGITGAGGYGAKNYTVNGSGANIVFTRKATGAAGNGALTVTDGLYTKTNAIKATGTLTVVAKANLVNNDYFILTDNAAAADAVCFYFDTDGTLADDGATAQACQDANGKAGGVEIDVSAATTAASVGALVETAINGVVAELTVTATDNEDGTLALEYDTAGTAGNIALNAGYLTEGVANGGFTLTALIGGAAVVNATALTATFAGGANDAAAAATVAVPGALMAASDDQSVTIDGVTIALGADAKTAIEVAGILTAGTYTTGAITNVDDDITFTKTATGTGGNGALAMTDRHYGGKKQVITFTSGDDSTSTHNYSVVINGDIYRATTRHGGAAALEALATQITGDLNSDATCAAVTNVMTCTARVSGTALTYSSSVSAASSGGGGGGGSSSTTPQTMSSTETQTQLQTQLTNLRTQLLSLLTQLVAQLQAQLSAMQ
ncbi:MAG: hypothetical protein WC565_07135 [Parcubacteria group bacterium]